jgi:hypothetical protein
LVKRLSEVYILILNYNGWRDTVECLESVQRLTYPNYRIVVIDNGSTDGSMDKIKAWAAGELPVESRFFTYDPSTKPVRWIEYDRISAEAGGLPELEAELDPLPPNGRMVLIQTGANLGYAGGNNVGIRYALARGADYIWLLNNDTVADRDALTEMVRLAESDEKIGMVGSKLLYYDRPNVIQGAGGGWFDWYFKIYGWLEEDRGQWDKIFDLGYVAGASLLAKTSLIKSVGMMLESFFMYGEDVEWQIRVKHSGYRLVYCPRSRVWHKENASSGYKSPFVEYYATRNSLWIVRRYYPWRLPVAIFFHLLRVGRRVFTGKLQRAAAVLKGIALGVAGKLAI